MSFCATAEESPGNCWHVFDGSILWILRELIQGDTFDYVRQLADSAQCDTAFLYKRPFH